MPELDIRAKAERIAALFRDCRQTDVLPAELRPADMAEAYRIRRAYEEVEVARGRGSVAGYKIAITTKVMQELCGIDEPCYGAIFAREVHRGRAELHAADYCRIAVETEIAVRLREDLPEGGDRERVAAAVESCMAAIELIEDLRYDYKRLDAAALVAGNAWNVGIVLGEPVTDWRRLDLAALTARLWIDDAEAGSGRGGDVMGHPLNALSWLADKLAAAGIEAVAVALIHSYQNPAHERAVVSLLEEAAPALTVSASSEVVPEIREYERTSTTVANVYVRPLVSRYLARLVAALRELGVRGELLVMLSSGGIGTVETASRFPIRLIESGPAAGALAAAHYGRLTDRPSLLSFDMGGTTAKACLIDDGQPTLSAEFEVSRVYRFKQGSGLPVKTPVIHLIEIGAGGGSIARVDALGLLKVGPDSAGADPGPACYGRGGTEPTVTDADLLLGYLDPEFFLGGTMRLDRPAAERAVGQLGEKLGLGLAETAWGIHQVVNEQMAGAARIHAVEEGKDPRAYPVFAFGGAGPVHAYRVAEILRAPELVVPLGAGVTSTVGFLVAPLAFDFVRSYVGHLDTLDWGEVNARYAEMEAEGREILTRAGVPPAEVTIARMAELRYVGQGHEVRVPVPPGELSAGRRPELVAAFEEVYRQLYGRTATGTEVEAISWRLLASGPPQELPLELLSHGAATTADAQAAIKGERPIYLSELGGYAPVPVYDRYRLAPGAVFAGPAVVEERESTAVIGPAAHVAVDDLLNLVVRLPGSPGNGDADGSRT